LATSAANTMNNPLDTPPPTPSMKQMPALPKAMTASTAAELRRKKAHMAERAVKVAAAGSQAATRMSEQSWQSGTQRGALFDHEQFAQAHAARQQSMEDTFERLYRPVGSAYWSAQRQQREQEQLRQERQQRQQEQQRVAASKRNGGIPPWTDDIPQLLSLDHAAFRAATVELDEVDPLTEPLAPSVPASNSAALPPFDPMAEPERFFRQFKDRVASLRADVAMPPSSPRPERAVQEYLPAPPAAAPAAEAAAPAEEESLDAMAIYLTSVEYLAECGIQVPSWEDAPQPGEASEAAAPLGDRPLA